MMHIPVMTEEVLGFLLHDKTQRIVDGTVGCGGHAAAILKANDSVRVIGLDRDDDALREAREVLAPYKDRAQLMKSNYANIDGALAETGRVDGVFVDLGVSSLQIDRADRGFSYSQDGPLDMRMEHDGATAAELLAGMTQQDLVQVLRDYGEVERAGRIARHIRNAADASEMSTTRELKAAVERAVGAGRTTPALLSRVFQSLRIAVNRELEHLDSFLSKLQDCLNPGARIVVLSYHSLEDRRVKKFFSRESKDCVCPPRTPVCVCGHVAWLDVLTRRVVKPSAQEVADNPRSRSARLRAAAVLN